MNTLPGEIVNLMARLVPTSYATISGLNRWFHGCVYGDLDAAKTASLRHVDKGYESYWILPNGKRHGEYRAYDVTGDKLFIKTKYIDGLQNGKRIVYSYSGVKLYETYYANDEYCGKIRDYYDSGKLCEEILTYTGGVQYCKSIKYYESGSVKSNTDYICRDSMAECDFYDYEPSYEKHGKMICYFESGGIKYTADYAKGKLHGVYTEYRESGVLKYKIQYARGKQHGIYRKYNKFGILKYKVWYVCGKKLKWLR